MQFDFYHAQIVGRDLVHRLEQLLPLIGHLQCAAEPSRHEPVNYRYVFEAMDWLGYAGWIGAEYHSRFGSEEGLGWAEPYGGAAALTVNAIEKPRFFSFRQVRSLVDLTMFGRSKNPPAAPDAAKAEPLKEAVREARIEAAERLAVVVDLRDAELARLELLDEALEPTFKDIPANIELFDRGISRGDVPRLWIDMVAHVEMGRDKRQYRFVQDTRYGRAVIAEAYEVPVMAEAVTRYVARRLVERERALADDAWVGQVAANKIARLERARERWHLFWIFILGLMIGAGALCALALLSQH